MDRNDTNYKLDLKWKNHHATLEWNQLHGDNLEVITGWTIGELFENYITCENDDFFANYFATYELSLKQFYVF